MKPAKTNREIIAPENWSELPMGDCLAMEIQHKLDEWCPFMFVYYAAVFTFTCTDVHQAGARVF